MRCCRAASDQECASCRSFLPLIAALGWLAQSRMHALNRAAPDALCATLQDAVPRVGKFLTLFSRPGKRVIIDYRGDVVVRPSPYEIFIRNGESAAAHAAPRPWSP